jgi:triosephosphate isomerase
MAAAQIRPLVAGNWKMNGLSGSNGEFEKIVGGAARLAGRADLMVCPPGRKLWPPGAPG